MRAYKADRPRFYTCLSRDGSIPMRLSYRGFQGFMPEGSVKLVNLGIACKSSMAPMIQSCLRLKAR